MHAQQDEGRILSATLGPLALKGRSTRTQTSHQLLKLDSPSFRACKHDSPMQEPSFPFESMEASDSMSLLQKGNPDQTKRTYIYIIPRRQPNNTLADNNIISISSDRWRPCRYWRAITGKDSSSTVASPRTKSKRLTVFEHQIASTIGLSDESNKYLPANQVERRPGHVMAVKEIILAAIPGFWWYRSWLLFYLTRLC